MWLLDMLSHKFQSHQINTTEPDPEIVKLLKTHPLFTELQAFKAVRIDNIDISDPIKKKMCICYFTIFYEQVELVVLDIVEDYPKYVGDAALISHRLAYSINNLREIALSNAIPKIFLDKYTPRIVNNIDILTNIITEVCQTKIYSDSKDEICAILDVTLTFMKFCLDSAEGIINHMNGELHMALEGSVFDV